MLRNHPLTAPAGSLMALLLVTALLAGCAVAGAANGVAKAPAVPAVSEQTAPAVGSGEGARAPDRLEIPAISADMPVVELGWHTARAGDDAVLSEWDVAEYAAGWHKNSALPGERGNVVMSGHNNILGSVFRELDQLRAGDDTFVWRDGERYAYTVDQVMIVPEKYASAEQRADNAKWIGEFDDERLTLVSCWPRNNNTHRIIVVARPADGADRANTVHASAETSGP